MNRILEVVEQDHEVEDARLIRVRDIAVQDWVREECRDCMYFGKSWSCPPGVGSLEEAGRELSGFSNAVFVKFRSSGDRKTLERAVLNIEAGLRKAGFSRAMGFFTSPCTACGSADTLTNARSLESAGPLERPGE